MSFCCSFKQLCRGYLCKAHLPVQLGDRFLEAECLDEKACALEMWEAYQVFLGVIPPDVQVCLRGGIAHLSLLASLGHPQTLFLPTC